MAFPIHQSSNSLVHSITGPHNGPVLFCSLVFVGVCRRRLSSVTRRIWNVTHQGAARGGPVVLRPVIATPCFKWVSSCWSFNKNQNALHWFDMSVSVFIYLLTYLLTLRGCCGQVMWWGQLSVAWTSCWGCLRAAENKTCCFLLQTSTYSSTSATPISWLVQSATRPSTSFIPVYSKASHTRYRELGPELIPVYRQSARSWL